MSRTSPITHRHATSSDADRGSSAALVRLAQDIVDAELPEERLAAIRLMLAALEIGQVEAVAAARNADVSWGRIAAAVGLKSRQAARQRFTGKPAAEDRREGPPSRDTTTSPPRDTARPPGKKAASAHGDAQAPQSTPRASATREAPEVGARSESTQRATGAVKLSVLGAEVARVAVTLRRARWRSVSR